MDITIVSFLPWALNELKPGLIPEQYYIPPAIDGKPGILHINDARSNLYVRDGKTYPITHPAEEVANSLVNDYCSAMLQAEDDKKPAIFWVHGKYSADDILNKFKIEIEQARKKQSAWFIKLVRLADDDWAKFGQHRMITDIQRYAAHNLGLVNKPWMQDLEPQQYTKCPACSTMVDITAAVCKNCGFVTNKLKAKELGIEGNKAQVRG